MHLEQQLVGEADFPELITALWEAYEEPHQKFFRVYCPIFNNDREKSLADSITFFQEEYRSSFPESQWTKVVDTDANNRIAGAALWKIHQTNPFENYNEDKVTADWYPEGSMERLIATKYLRDITAPRAKKARRPHIFLNIAFTVPSYRRHGVGSLFLQWGLDKAEEMGLECWLDATPYGRPVYERRGFICTDAWDVDCPMPEGLSEEKKREFEAAREQLLPVPNACMWRPKGGVYIEGVTEKPWETKDQA
ncbi:hypothetical protein MferCBS31731_002687 [Microsporum ferrugineum]